MGKETYYYRCPICETGYKTQAGFNVCRSACNKKKLNIRVIWGDGKHSISYESFKSQDELDGYLRAIDDHDGWLSAEVHTPDKDGKFESLEEETIKSLLALGYDEDDLKNDFEAFVS